MFTLILAAALAATAPTPEELIRQLDDDSWRTREKATAQLVDLCIKNKAAFDAATKAVSDKNTSLEARYRLRRIIGEFYRPMWSAKAPIWSLPKEIRYVKDKDVALEYYEKAKKTGEYTDGDTKYYNHEQLMVLATQLYIKDRLAEFKDRKNIEEFTTKINTSWKEEEKLMQEYVEGTAYGGNIYHEKPPVAVEERVKFLKKKIDSGEDKWTWQVESSKCIAPTTTYFPGDPG